MSSYLSHRRKGFQGGVTAFDGFGNRSRSFDGVSDYVSIPDINESTTNLSVALWVKTTDVDWVTTHFGHWRNQDNNRAWWIGPSRTSDTNGKKLMVYLSADGDGLNPVKRYYGTTDVSDGTWHHVAFTWDNGTLKLFVDGSEETTTKVINHTMTTIINSNGPITVGCTFANGVPANFGSGGRADIRIYNSTLTATDISDIYNGKNITTNLAGHWLTDADDTEDKAGSNNGTNYGSKYSYDNPSPPVEFGSASRVFNGTSDYITAPDGSWLPRGAQTWACWVKYNSSGTYAFFNHNGSSPNRSIQMVIGTTNKIQFQVSADGINREDFQSVSSLTQGEWYHIACVFNPSASTGQGRRIYINGVLDQNGSTNYTLLHDTNQDVGMGANGAGLFNLDGSLADCRIYDADIGDAGVSDLYNGKNITTNLAGHWLTDNDDVEDKAGTNDGTNYGSTYSYDNPPMDLIPSRQASRSFNGASDYITVQDGSWIPTGAQTWACWIKPDADSIVTFFNHNVGTGNQRSVNLITYTGGVIYAQISPDGVTTISATSPSSTYVAGEWIHVAFTFAPSSSTGLKLYINGSLETVSNVSSMASVFNSTADIGIGANGLGQAPFQGSICDCRIYDTDLTATDISDIYNGTTDRTNLIGQWLTNSNDVLDHAGTNDGTNNGSTYSTDSPS